MNSVRKLQIQAIEDYLEEIKSKEAIDLKKAFFVEIDGEPNNNYLGYDDVIIGKIIRYYKSPSFFIEFIPTKNRIKNEKK